MRQASKDAAYAELQGRLHALGEQLRSATEEEGKARQQVRGGGLHALGEQLRAATEEKGKAPGQAL